MVYIALSLLICISAFIEINLKNKKFIFLERNFLVIILIIFTGFRYKVGYDYNSYEKIFNEIKTLEFNQLLNYKFAEIGYTLLNKIYNNYNILLLSVGILNISLKMKALKKMTCYPIFSFFVYYSINYLDGDFGKIRNAIAATFFLLAISKINNKKVVILLILMGSLFHYSLIATLLIVFIKPKIYTQKKYLGIFLISYLFLGVYFKLLLDTIIIYLPEYIQNKIYYYQFFQKNDGINFVNISLILRVLFMFYFYFNSQKFTRNQKIYFNIYFLGVCLYPILTIIPELTRIANYYKLVECVLFAVILKENYSKKKCFFLLSFFLFYSLYNVFKIVYISPEEFLPYKNYLLILIKQLYIVN